MSYPITVYVLKTGPQGSEKVDAGTPCTGVSSQVVRPEDVPEFIKNALGEGGGFCPPGANRGEPTKSTAVTIHQRGTFYQFTTESRIIS